MNEKIIRLNIAKKEIFFKINKSIIQNNNIENSIKIYTSFSLVKKIKKHNHVSKKNKICLYSGKRKTVLKGFSFSRYFLKRLILKNLHTNIKKNNW